MAFGTNEIAQGITGHNYIQEWTGMSDSTYGYLYLGLNISSSIGTVAGRLGMRAFSSIDSNKAKIHFKPYGKINSSKNIYYYDGAGNPYWTIHNCGKTTQHWHTSLGRDGEHIYSYLKFIIKFVFRKW